MKTKNTRKLAENLKERGKNTVSMNANIEARLKQKLRCWVVKHNSRLHMIKGNVYSSPGTIKANNKRYE